ncbi:MAG: hypothetical protein Q4F13_02840 [Pseudomonadota bacterium]|nr:hypothetical protein [Pseudomonadota bacterium]
MTVLRATSAPPRAAPLRPKPERVDPPPPPAPDYKPPRRPPRRIEVDGPSTGGGGNYSACVAQGTASYVIAGLSRSEAEKKAREVCQANPGTNFDNVTIRFP